MKPWFAYQLAICSIVYNEGRYLKEWLDYHRLIGFQKFYIYDNESTDGTKGVLEPYIADGIVDYVFYPGRAVQYEAYKDCIRKRRFEAEWLAILDLDEFIHPFGKNLYEILRLFRCRDKYMGGLGMQWQMFGAGGHEERPEGGVIDNYCCRADRGNWSTYTIKSIVNPRLVVPGTSGLHFFQLFSPFHIVNERGEVVLARHTNTQDDPRVVCVNHYFSKSREEWMERRSHKTADGAVQRGVHEFEKFQKYLNRVYDDSLKTCREELLAKFAGSGNTPPEKSQSSMEDFQLSDGTVEDLLAILYRLEKEKEPNAEMMHRAISLLHERFSAGKAALWELELMYSVIRGMEPFPWKSGLMEDLRRYLSLRTAAGSPDYCE